MGYKYVEKIYKVLKNGVGGYKNCQEKVSPYVPNFFDNKNKNNPHCPVMQITERKSKYNLNVEYLVCNNDIIKYIDE